MRRGQHEAVLERRLAARDEAVGGGGDDLVRRAERHDVVRDGRAGRVDGHHGRVGDGAVAQRERVEDELLRAAPRVV